MTDSKRGQSADFPWGADKATMFECVVAICPAGGCRWRAHFSRANERDAHDGLLQHWREAHAT